MNNSRMVDLFLEIVQIDSPTGEEPEFADFLVDYLAGKVDSVKKDSANNLFITVAGRGEPILLNAHLDTVEPGRGIKPIIKKGMIQTEGTTILGADNKLGIAGIIEAILQLKEKTISHRPIEVLLTSSEEVGSYGALGFDYSQLTAKTGYCFDYTNPVGAIVTASPFYERFDVEIIGKASHASRPQGSINTLLVLKDILASMQIGIVDDDTILNIGVVSGGHVRNTIPGNLSLKGEIRSFIEENLVTHKESFFTLLDQVTKSHQATYTIDSVRENGGYKYPVDYPLIKAAEKAIQKIGRKPTLIPVWGVSDVNTFVEKGVEMINLANGGENAHTVEERVPISEMEKLVELIIELVRV